MRFSLALVAFVAASVFAAPIERRQGAGVGAGCDSIFSDTDTTIGETSRGTGQNVAGQIKGAGARRNYRRQGAGVGAGCNSIFSDTDTTIGETSRGTGQNVAGQIDSAKGVAKRQLNGISDGATAVTGTVPGAGGASQTADQEGNAIDGDGTNGSADAGATVGNTELSLGQDVLSAESGKGSSSSGGSPPPPQGGNPPPQGGNPPPQGGNPPPPHHRRQLNGISDGATAVTGTVPGAGGASQTADQEGNAVDGDGTQGSASAGATVGNAELSAGQDVLSAESGKGSSSSGGSSPPPSNGGGSPPPAQGGPKGGNPPPPGH